MTDATDSRWALLGDVLVFQVKLGVDAARDVLLSPVSLVAALLDLISGGDRQPSYFHQVLALGRRSEGWINLFGREPDPADERVSLDRLVERVEGLVVEQYERGGMTAQAKAAIDRSLDVVSRKRAEAAPPARDGGDAPEGQGP